VTKVEDIAAAKVATIDEVVADPQVLHRKMVLSLEHPLGGEIKLAGNLSCGMRRTVKPRPMMTRL
jgi:crotonobetainyl-CoA:carnitine CoA-transferase CaiB-like acyl-CoA transferase